jgi:proteasome assembly chaperone 3
MATTAAAQQDYKVTPTPYPARTQTSSSAIQGIETTATAVNFTDKIVITVTQNGRLAHWVSIAECMSKCSSY